MSKINKVKNLKNMVSSLDINKLYSLQNYVNISSKFFNNLESMIIEYISSNDEESDFIFIENVINLYNYMKNDLKIK